MSVRPPSPRKQKSTLRLTLRVLGLACALLLPLTLLYAADLSFPPPQNAGTLLVGESSLVELAGFATTLWTEPSPNLGTPAWETAYRDAEKLAGNQAIKVARELGPAGFTPQAFYRYVLLHSPPPELALRGRALSSGRPDSDTSFLLSHKPESKRITEGLRKLYESGRIEFLSDRYARARESTIRAYRDAFPEDEPYGHLVDLTGEPRSDGPIYLVPSLLAQSRIRVTVPAEAGSPPVRLSVIPMGEDGIPDATAAARTRYYELLAWALEPVFARFQLEFQELSRTRKDVEDQLIMALQAYDMESQYPELFEGLLSDAQQEASPLVPVFIERLKHWEAVRGRFATLSQYLPELLDAAFLALEGKVKLPRLRDPGFEEWDGVVPREWSIEVVEPATESPRPSKVARVRGLKRDSWSLMLSGDQHTNQWLGVVSMPVPVVAGDRVHLRARMRARNVTPRGSRIRAAHMEVRVVNLDGSLLRRIAGREFLGTTNWETVDIEFVVPAAAASMQVGCVLAMTGELYFDDISMNVERASVRHFLRNGGFESMTDNLPTDWSVGVASIQTQSGPSVSSLWTLDSDRPYEGSSSLKLSGDDLTGQWLEVRSPELHVAPGQKITLAAQARSRDVRLGPRQHRHANLTLTFVNERGREVATHETPLMEGAQEEWVPVRLEVTAPLEASGVRVGCLLTMSGSLWVDDIHLSRR